MELGRSYFKKTSRQLEGVKETELDGLCLWIRSQVWYEKDDNDKNKTFPSALTNNTTIKSLPFFANNGNNKLTYLFKCIQRFVKIYCHQWKLYDTNLFF